MATCLACGADTFELGDLGEVHSAGRDVEQTPQYSARVRMRSVPGIGSGMGRVRHALTRPGPPPPVAPDWRVPALLCELRRCGRPDGRCRKPPLPCL
jgi:hypothetical protein